MVEERELGAPWLKTRVQAGDFFLTGSQSPTEVRWRAIGPEPLETMHVYLGLPVFHRAIEEAFQKDQGATYLRDLSGFKDNFLSALLDGLHKELSARYRGSSLFVEGIAQSLAGHLVRTYAEETTQESKGGLPGFRLRKVTDLMVTHLEDEFSLIREGLEQIDLLGFSLGGLVAQQLTLDRPKHVRRLVLVGTGPRSGEGMATLTPEAKAIFGKTYGVPEELWL